MAIISYLSSYEAQGSDLPLSQKINVKIETNLIKLSVRTLACASGWHQPGIRLG